MDIGTLLLMLAIATLTVAFILQPLFARRKPQRDELIAHWLEELGREHIEPQSDASLSAVRPARSRRRPLLCILRHPAQGGLTCASEKSSSPSCFCPCS